MPARERVPALSEQPAADAPGTETHPDPRNTGATENTGATGERAAPEAPGTDPATSAALAADPAAALALLRDGVLAVHGRVTDASNAVLYCTATLDGLTAPCVYKPVAGERPLWDFPDGTLAGRETAAHEVSAATGWRLVPPTLLREGPAGPGMVQLWIEPDPDAPELLDLQPLETGPHPGWLPILRAEVDGGRQAWLVHRDDERLRRLAVLDAVLNNADRKGGHWLPAADGRIYGIDHGVTFHTDPKLRTLLWGWAGQPLTDEAREVLDRLAADLAGPLGERLRPHLTAGELAALAARTDALRSAGRHPLPSAEWPSIPWPPV